MTEQENVKNQDDALKDTVNHDLENNQEPAEEQPANEKKEEKLWKKRKRSVPN